MTPQPQPPQPQRVLPPPPTDTPPIITDTPRAVDTPAPPPSPPTPAPPQPPARPAAPSGDLTASMCVPVRPQYPREAERAGITGTVVVTVSFNNSGTITEASVKSSSGNRDLDRAALTAARRAKLCPGSGDGSGYFPVNFVLN